MNDTTTSARKGATAIRWATRLVIAGVVLLVAGLVLPRAGLSPMIAMLLMTLGSLVLIVAGGFGMAGLIRGQGLPRNGAWLAVALGVFALGNAGYFVASAMSGGAPIHDISTDTQDPPAFVAVAALRGPSDNPPEYAGAETATMQKEAYPDIQPLILLDPRSFVFDTALQVAEDMGWEIVASDPATGRIEATATTAFAGFKDDVVIRVRADSAETIVDVRSKSRVGRGDMGVNANRIREFSRRLLAAVEP